MFCRFCGAELPEDTIFCSKCGKRVQKDGGSSDAGEAAKPVRKKPRSRGAVLAGLLILAVLAVVLVFVLSGRNREQGQQGNDAGNDPMQQSPVSVDEVRFDGNGEADTVVIVYTWTNLTENEISAAESVTVHAYQNGIALESADSAAAGGDLRQRKGKPGTAVALEAAFYLDDRTTEVLVEVTPQRTGSGIVYFSKTYSCTIAATEEPTTEEPSTEEPSTEEPSTEEPGSEVMDPNGDISAPTVDDPAFGAESPVPVEPEPVNRQTNGSRLYEITKPREASLTPDDFIGTWETKGGIVFTIDGGNGEYSIDLSENEGLGLIGGWFQQEIYNIEGAFCGMSGFNDFNGFEVSYQYSTDDLLNTFLNVTFETYDGTVISDSVPLVQG